MLQGHVSAFVELLAVLVVQHRVAVREGATAAVFARQAHWVARGHQRGKSHVLAHAPVNVDLAAPHGRAVVNHLLHQRMQFEVGRNRGDALGQAAELGQRQGRVGGVGPLLVQERGPVDRVLALEVGQHRIDRVLACLHGCTVSLDHVVRTGLTQRAAANQLVAVHLAGAGVLTDLLVHQRLGHRGRVLLVVTELAETHDVDHHVLVELLTVVQRELGAQHHGFRIIAVDVQHRGFDHLDDVGAIQRRAGVARVGGGETDLVVDDDVDRAAGVVTAGLGQCQRFHHDALAGEGRVTVHLNGQHLRALGIAATIHPGLDRALDHRVDDFQVRGVERQREVNRATRGGHVAREALVVLHVAGGQVLGSGVLEFGEQVLGLLAQGVDQHVQAATVGHADDDFLHTFFTSALNELVHRGNERLTALQRKTLLADVLGVEESLQTFGGSQSLENVLLLLGAEGRLGADGLQAFLPPAFFGGVGDVHVLGADAAAVRLTQGLHDFAQGHVLGLGEVGVRRREGDVHVRLGEVVEGRFELGDFGAFLALERIEVGPAGTQEAVGGDQRLDMNLLAGDSEVGRAGLDHEGIGLRALSERLDHRGMRHISVIRAVRCRDVLKRVKVRAPVVGDGTGVVEVGLIQLFHIWGVAPEQVRVRPELLHHFSLTLLPGFLGRWLVGQPSATRLDRLADCDPPCCDCRSTHQQGRREGLNS